MRLTAALSLTIGSLLAGTAHAQIFVIEQTTDMAFERVTQFPASTFPRLSDPVVTEYDGSLYFLAYDPTTGTELWRRQADGTVSMVADHAPGTAEGAMNAIGWSAVADGRLYFNGYDAQLGWQLHAWDGNQISLAAGWPGGSQYFDHLHEWDDTLYLTPDGEDPEKGWRFDGAAFETYGPFPIAQNDPLPPEVEAVLDDALLYREVDLAGNATIVAWDGEEATILDEYPGYNGQLTVTEPVRLGNRAYFTTVWVSGNGWQLQLLESDGTSVTAVSPPWTYGPANNPPGATVVRMSSAWYLDVGDRFLRYHTSTGWTDLTSTVPAGVSLRNINALRTLTANVILGVFSTGQQTEPAVFDGSSWQVYDIGTADDIFWSTQAGDALYFSATTVEHDRELWRMFASEFWHFYGEWNPLWENTTEWPMDEEIVLGAYLIDPEAAPQLTYRSEPARIAEQAGATVDLYSGDGSVTVPDVAGLLVVAFSNDTGALLTSELHVISDPDGTGEADLEELADDLLSELDLDALLGG